MENKGEIFFGDKVVLRAKVSDANAAYSIRWEMDKGNGWEAIGGEHDTTYDFVVSEENANYAYRVVLVVEG